MGTLTLTKYHGLGNDFLVLVDPERAARYDPALVAALCDRHRGVGADGVLRVSSAPVGAAFTMELRNADGGLAETSGNGLRCAVLAAFDAGLLPHGAYSGEEFAVATGAGPVAASLVEIPLAGEAAEVRVAMGVATVETLDTSPIDGRRAHRVDVGNPHLVLLGARVGDVDLRTVGPRLEVSEPAGINVEVAALRGEDLELVVWERGAGLTQACGSGSCAVAAAARAEGLVENSVVVHNPGGPLLVELDGDLQRARVALTGPAKRVATISIDLDDLELAEGITA